MQFEPQKLVLLDASLECGDSLPLLLPLLDQSGDKSPHSKEVLSPDCIITACSAVAPELHEFESALDFWLEVERLRDQQFT
jgi:hypothetical protein